MQGPGEKEVPPPTSPASPIEHGSLVATLLIAKTRLGVGVGVAGGGGCWGALYLRVPRRLGELQARVVGEEWEQWTCVVCATPCFPPLATCLWCPFSAWGPGLSGCERRAWEGWGIIRAMERATCFQEVAEGKPVGWQPTPQCWLWPQEGEGMKGAVVQDEGGSTCGMQPQRYVHTGPPHVHPGTPRQTQGQELLDTPTWGQGKRQVAAAQGSSEGWDTPTGDREQGDRPMHIPTHGVTRRCCHTRGQGGVVVVTHTEKVTIARMHEHRAIAHSLTLQKTLSLTGTHVLA